MKLELDLPANFICLQGSYTLRCWSSKLALVGLIRLELGPSRNITTRADTNYPLWNRENPYATDLRQVLSYNAQGLQLFPEKSIIIDNHTL